MNFPNLEGFVELPFPQTGEVLYVLCFRRPGKDVLIPFYVGETTRHVGRFGDYVSAKFSAQTDFKVGTAARLLKAAGCEVVIKYRESADRRTEERQLIEALQAQKCRLLNDLRGYNYETAKEVEEAARIAAFVTALLSD